MTITLAGLNKRYSDGTWAVRGIDLEVREGEFVTLLGPSGCGKTTTLRLVAGLEEPTGGCVLIGGRDVTRTDPGDRDVAMVFQSYALYPHMTVAENMTLNLIVRGMRKAEAMARARETAQLLGIEELLDKKPAKLSGGQRQRVALGRAIVRRPAVFLMDEPLSSLDLKLREQMRTELKALHARLRITTIYVTHDQTEALILSDRVVVLNAGKVEQTADPVSIYERPANRFVAEFIGSPGINLLAAQYTEHGLSIGSDLVGGAPFGDSAGSALLLGVRPEHVLMGHEEEGALQGRIAFFEPYGSAVYAFIELLSADITRNRAHLVAGMDPQHPHAKGERVGLNFRWDRVLLFNAQTGAVLPSHSQLGVAVRIRKEIA